MKMSRIAITIFGAALLVSASAFAKDSNNKGTLRLEDNVTVAGTPLNPGNYKVEWNGNGPDVQVTLLQGNHTVATFPAHVTEQATAPNADAYGSNSQPNGGKVLTSIYFGGKHYALEVQPNASAQNQQNNSNAAK